TGLTANFDGSGHLIDITGTPVFDTVPPIVNTYTLTYTVSDGVLTDSNNTVSLTVIDTTSGNNIVPPLDGNDFSYIDGQSGDDTITGDLILIGNAGIDIFIGNNGMDTFSGGAGNDTVNGESNDDALDGGVGNDILNGGNNDDTLIGGAGNDTLTGGNGNDSFRWNSTAEFGDTVADFTT